MWDSYKCVGIRAGVGWGGVLSEEREKKAERAGEGGPPGAPSLVKEGRVCNFLELVTVSELV